MILTEEQLLIQETARKFAQERLAPIRREWEQEGRLSARASSRSSASWASWA